MGKGHRYTSERQVDGGVGDLMRGRISGRYEGGAVRDRTTGGEENQAATANLVAQSQKNGREKCCENNEELFGEVVQRRIQRGGLLHVFGVFPPK